MTASPDRAIHGTPTAARRHAFRRVVTVQGGSITVNELGVSELVGLRLSRQC